jgi:hypothetical protein
MKERPILFSGPMVRAILAGQKTQTRRVIRGIDYADRFVSIDGGKAVFTDSILDRATGASHLFRIRCPGMPGDRLWVREAWARAPDGGLIYRANFNVEDGFGSEVVDLPTGRTIPLRWLPSIHMTRAASRITLEIVGVRVERLQEITETDILAEGTRAPVTVAGEPLYTLAAKPFKLTDYVGGDPRMWSGAEYLRANFGHLWDSINAKRGYPWTSNPWVWVIEFGVARKELSELEFKRLRLGEWPTLEPKS